MFDWRKRKGFKFSRPAYVLFDPFPAISGKLMKAFENQNSEGFFSMAQ